LVQAESTLIGAAATLELINAELVRPNLLYNSSKGVAQRELEQATSDQKTAEAALKAARDAVRVFGKTALSALRVDVIAWWIAAITSHIAHIASSELPRFAIGNSIILR